MFKLPPKIFKLKDYFHVLDWQSSNRLLRSALTRFRGGKALLGSASLVEMPPPVTGGGDRLHLLWGLSRGRGRVGNFYQKLFFLF